MSLLDSTHLFLEGPKIKLFFVHYSQVKIQDMQIKRLNTRPAGKPKRMTRSGREEQLKAYNLLFVLQFVQN